MNDELLSSADRRLIREALLRMRDQVDLPAVGDRCTRLADTFGEALALEDAARECRKSGVVLNPMDALKLGDQ